ncbi:MAG: BatA and WFA domain-containing protein [Chthoniobacteraceae bacterium]|nr:BatA and WFA domain-containing protein [Chthoniobacteraceae bacterium]
MISFANPYFLLALAGIAAPVLIHYLMRDHIKRAVFSTARFFNRGATVVIRHKKFRELFLIVLRCLVVAILACIFARPFLRQKSGVNTPVEAGTARVVVADVSGSMRREGLPEALKKEALAAFDSLKQGEDEAALIAFAGAPGVREPLGKDLAERKEAARALAAGYGGTNLPDALRKAGELLRGIRAAHKEIVVISDFPRQGWRGYKGDWKLAEDVKVTLRPLRPAATRVSPCIVEASAPGSLVLDGQPSSLAVRVANFSGEPCKDAAVTLALKGREAETQRVSIRPGGTASVRFRHVFDTPGDNPGSISVGAGAGEKGSVFYFNARTLPRIPVLLLTGRPSANPQADAAFFIGKAIAPGEESPFALKVLAAEKVTSQEIAAASVVILADVGELPAPVIGSLTTLMQRGGGVFFLPGANVKAEAFNAAFESLAPCKLRQVLAARPASGESAESLMRVDFEHPVFEVFSAPHHGDLTLPKFAKYWETTDTQLSRVLARFGDGRPAILERERGKGVAMAMMSAVDADWNDFAYQSVFLPYLHQTLRYLAVRGGQRTAYSSGDVLPLPEGGTLKDPAGRVHPAAEAAVEPGFYNATNKNGEPDFCYAVNGNFAEGDPAAVAPEEIKAAIERVPGEAEGGFDLATTTAAVREGQTKDGGLWWVLLCGLLVLTMAELAVGNKTLRH